MSVEALFILDGGAQADGEGLRHIGRRAAERCYEEVMGPYSGGPAVYELIGSKMPDPRYEMDELCLRWLTERLCELDHPEAREAEPGWRKGKCYICKRPVPRMMRWSVYPVDSEYEGVMEYGAPKIIESAPALADGLCQGSCARRMRVKMANPSGYLYESEYVHDCRDDIWRLRRYCGGYIWTRMPELRIAYRE